MTKYINLFGGPGVGKSTTAAAIFVEMKKTGFRVELVTEVAKDFVWEDRSTTLSIQPYITIKQFRNLVRLKDKVDYVITDAPILMGSVYADMYAPELPDSYHKFISDLHEMELNPSVNFVLERVFEYDTTGRYQSEKTAIDIDKAIEDVLMLNGVNYFKLSPSNLNAIIGHITKM